MKNTREHAPIAKAAARHGPPEPEHFFESNLARAATLPAAWYSDSAQLRMENDKVFSCTWQLAGRLAQVEKPGDYFTTTVGDEPVLVVRGQDEKLRSFSNVCRHRAGPVAAESGNRNVFQCGYHGWTYAADGRLLGTPEFDGVECFNKEANCLPQFRVEAWGALVFVNLDSTCAPLGQTLEDLPARVAHHDLSGLQLAARKDWYVDCNWKVYVDNYLEGYHIPILHPGLNRELDYSRYRVETKHFYSIQHAPIKRVANARINLGDAGAGEAQYFWLFPNLMLNIYPDNLSTNLIVPLGPTRTLTVFEWYARNPEDPEAQKALERTIAFSDEIQLEDIAICEAVQRGLGSRYYERGRYSVKRENGVHHFHGLLSNFLSS